MKWRHIIILAIIGAIVLITYNKNNQAKRQAARSAKITATSETGGPGNTYKELRNLAINETMDQMGIEAPQDKTKIYGVIMDWDLGEETATLVAFLSGDASLYLSSGGGIIGGIGQKNVHRAAIALVKDAENYLNQTVKTANTSLSVKDGVKFYFLTNKGIYSGAERMENFENNTSTWANLFDQANNLITAIRTSPAVEHSK